MVTPPNGKRKIKNKNKNNCNVGFAFIVSGKSILKSNRDEKSGNVLMF